MSQAIRKKPKTYLPYVPKRANRNESIIRRVAGALRTQAELDAYLLQVGRGKPPHQEREYRERAFQEISRFLPWAKKPWWWEQMDSSAPTGTVPTIDQSIPG